MTRACLICWKRITARTETRHMARHAQSQADRDEQAVAHLGSAIRMAEIHGATIGPTDHEIAQGIRERVWARKAARGGAAT